MNNLGWLAATPNGRKRENADQIVNAPSKVFNLLRWMSGLHFRP
jgi:hypothetical protein